MKKVIFIIGLSAATIFANAQNIYHEDDKEGLRMFLRQPSAIAGQINAEQLGLTISDTLGWDTSEVWVEKIVGVMWALHTSFGDTLERIRVIGNWNLDFDGWGGKNLAGKLDATKWVRMYRLECFDNLITELDLSLNTNLQDLYLNSNLITELDLRGVGCLHAFDCADNQISTLIDHDTCWFRFFHTVCNNRLQLSDLYNILVTSWDFWNGKAVAHLGIQRLLPREIIVGSVVNFSAQATFLNHRSVMINTVFAVKKGNNTAVLNTDYTINHGRITFKTTGQYTVTMTNAAIYEYMQICDSARVIAEFTVIDTADATLSSLSVSVGELTPIFDKDTLCYIVNVGCEVEEIDISATPNDPKATLSGDAGAHYLAEGENIFTITVTARNGITTRDYTVIVNRCNVGIAKITNYELQITGYEVYDIMGRKLFSLPSYLSLQEITEQVRNDVSNGIYIIKLYTNQGIITKKIIINQ